MEVELMLTKHDDDRQRTDRVNIEQSASGRLREREKIYFSQVLTIIHISHLFKINSQD